jgi:hypothetical protein
LLISDLVRRESTADRFGRPLPLLAAIDSADLLFQVPARRRTSFLKDLATTITSTEDLHMLLVVRTRHRDEREALVTDFVLDAFTPSAARQAVTGPRQMT